MTEWGMQFPEEKREAAKKATKLGRFAAVEVSSFYPSLSAFFSLRGEIFLRRPCGIPESCVADAVRLGCGRSGAASRFVKIHDGSEHSCG
jgi:hypothetical protein